MCRRVFMVMKDIDPDDRQDFSSLEKVMQTKVIDALSVHVPNSEATVMYIKICFSLAEPMKKTFHQLTEFTEFGMLPFFSEFGENG